MEVLFNVFFAVAGLLSLIGGVMDWDWVVTGRRGRFIAMIAGRTGARIFYIVLGMFLMVFGLLGVLMQQPAP